MLQQSYFHRATQPKDNIFPTQGNTVQASDLEMHAETHNFPWRKIKITKCERCTVETSINKFFVREGVFFHFLNERFVPNRTGDIIFATRSSAR